MNKCKLFVSFLSYLSPILLFYLFVSPYFLSICFPIGVFFLCSLLPPVFFFLLSLCALCLLFFLLSSWHSPNSMPSFNKTKEVLRDVEEGEMWNDRPEGQQRTAALWRPNYSFKTIQKEHSFPPLTLRFNFWNSFLKTINLAQIGSDF